MKIICKKLVSINHPNGFCIEQHTHPWHEFVYCLEGKGRVTIADKKSEFSTGSYYITRKETVHSEIDERGNRIIHFCFDAPDDIVREGVYADYDGSVLSLLKRLQRETRREDTYSDEMSECFIKGILIEALRSANSPKGRNDMLSLLQYVDENIEQDIDFKKLAAKQHYSFDHFRHVFKEHTGMSPHRYLIKGRIDKACFLLKINPDASLSEISYNCGFASSSHFTKAFRANKGMTPSQYASLQKK